MRREIFVCVLALILVAVSSCSRYSSPDLSAPVIVALFKTDVEALVEELSTKMEWKKYPLLFSVKAEAQRDLNNGIISADLRQEFEDNGNLLSNDAFVSVKEIDDKWLITDEDKVYTVKKREDELDIYKYPVNVGLGSFYYGSSEMNSRMGSQLSFFFASAVRSAITNMEQFELITYEDLNEVLNVKGLQMTDLVAGKRNFEQIEGLDALLVGKCSELKGGAWLEGRLIRVSSAEEAVVTIVTMNVPDVPDQPPNYKRQMRRIKDTIGDLIEQESDFHVTIEPERTDVYRKGAELRLSVKSERNCYIKIFSTAPDGETRLIFPNKYWLEYHSPTENFIRAGDRTPIPYESSFTLKVTRPPYGTEVFTLVASTRPFVPHDDSFYRERGAFPMIGNIDKKEGAKALRTGAKTVEAVPGSPGKSAEFAHSYCTIMTER